MKRILIPLLCSLLGLWSCKFEDTFTMQNVDDLVTVKDGKLVNDQGIAYNVVEDVSETADWNVEGARYYMVFDIQNRNMDICIRSLMQIKIQEALSAEISCEGHDPVMLIQRSVSGGYLNLGLGFYKDPKTESTHPIEFRYELDSSSSLHFTIFHDGADENPTTTATENLKILYRYYSIPLSNFQTATALYVTLDVLGTDLDNKTIVTSQTIRVL